MNHFDGVTPEQRWKNELLNCMKENNRLLNEILIDKHSKEITREAIKEDDGQMTLDMMADTQKNRKTNNRKGAA